MPKEEEKMLEEKLAEAANAFEDFRKRSEEEQEKHGKALGDTVAKLEELTGKMVDIEAKLKRPMLPEEKTKEEEKTESKASYLKYLREGEEKLKPEEWKMIPQFGSDMKTLIFSDDTTGGYLATPPEMSSSIISNIIEFSPIRQFATVASVGTSEYHVPKRTAEHSASWVAEVGTRSETTGLTFGKEIIPCHELYAHVNVSRQNLADTAYDLEGIVTSVTGEKFGVAEGTAFISGSGSGRPEGITINADMIGTYYTASGHATTIPNADCLNTLIFAVKGPYWNGAQFYMHRTSLLGLHNVKDGEGRYLLQTRMDSKPGFTLKGFPAVECTDLTAPSTAGGLTYTANSYPVIFGDMRQGYTVVDREGVATLRDPYSNATTGTVTLHFWKRVGGQVVKPEALRLLKVAAS